MELGPKVCFAKFCASSSRWGGNSVGDATFEGGGEKTFPYLAIILDFSSCSLDFQVRYILNGFSPLYILQRLNIV